MVKKTFYVNLDIKQPSTNPDIVVVEGDNGNEIVVTLTDDGGAVDLTGCKVLAVFALPDQRTVQQDNNGHGITMDGVNKCTFTIDLYTTSFVNGFISCEIQVMSGIAQDTLVTSAQFNFECRRSIMNKDTIQATPEYPILIGLIQRTEAVETGLAPIELNESTRQSNESTRVTHESGRVTAESGRVTAENNRGMAESGRVTAEQGRVSAESGRASAESGRVSAEQGRANAEGLRVSAETSRASAESTRVTKESQRVTAETNRGNAETARASAESTRGTSESTRVSQESARVSAESSRASAESGRTSAESTRASNETARGNAETARASAETGRSTAESGRVSAESGRVSAESSRAGAESSRASAETARASAESARSSAETARAGRDTAFQVWEAYSAVKAYVPLNKVQYGGSSYICIAPTTGNAPPNATYWQLIAAKGIDGTGAGDMNASVYAESPGVVKDAAKFGGQLPTYYAAAADLKKMSALTDIRTGPWTTRNASGAGLNKYQKALDALDAGADGIKNIVLLSASDGEGYAADEATPLNNITKGFAGLLNSAYAARYQDTGIGFIHCDALQYGGSPWTYSAGHWNWLNGYGISNVSKYAATAGATASFVFRGTGVVLTCVRGSSTGAFTATIDGVSKGSFNTNNASIVGAADYTIAAAGTLTDGLHTLTITTSSAAIVMIVGAYPLTNATRGIRLIRGCYAGAPVGYFSAYETSLYAEIDNWQPILTIIALVANDVAAGTTIADFKTRTQTLITRAKNFGDVILYADWPRPDYGASAGDPYVIALQELSDANDVPLIDTMTAYKGKLTTLGYVASDNIHPNAAGHQLLYRALAELLLGDFSTAASTYSAGISADVSIATANTWYTGASLSLPSGIYLLTGHVTALRSTTTAVTYSARISDGTNHYATAGAYEPSVANHIVTLTMATIIALTATTTINLQATANQTATIKAALVTNPSGNTATRLTAVKIM